MCYLLFTSLLASLNYFHRLTIPLSNFWSHLYYIYLGNYLFKLILCSKVEHIKSIYDLLLLLSIYHIWRFHFNKQDIIFTFTLYSNLVWGTKSVIYWVTQKLPQICTVILHIRIGKVEWFEVYICCNFWVTQYTPV